MNLSLLGALLCVLLGAMVAFGALLVRDAVTVSSFIARLGALSLWFFVCFYLFVQALVAAGWS